MSLFSGWPFRRLRLATALGPVLLLAGIILILLQPANGGPPLSAAVGILLAAAGVWIWLETIRLVHRLTEGIETLQFALRKLRSAGTEHDVALPEPPELSGLTETLRMLTEALRRYTRSEARERRVLETVLNSIPSAVLVVDARRRVRLLNEPARRLIGTRRTGAAPIEAYLRDLRLVEALDRALKHRQSSAFELELPAGASGPTRTLAAVVQPLTGEGDKGAPEDPRGSGAVLALHDISDIRRLERARRDLIANVSHELKTPVAIIQGFAETLREGALERPEGRDFLRRIEDESRRIASLVDRLLLLARLEQPDFRPQLTRVRLNALLTELVASRSPLADARGITLETDLVDPSPELEADPELLRQAIGNLLDNALRHTPDGGSVGVTTVVDASGYIEIRVSDTGPGVPPEHRDRIFERFYRVDPGRTRAAGGTGLGLAIVKHVAQVHGGSVGVDSRPASGATFWIRLPAGGTRDPAPPAASPAPEATGEAPGNPHEAQGV